jgi:hypothetical protein
LAAPVVRLIDHNVMGVDAKDMSRYSEMFNRHNEITRTVEDLRRRVTEVDPQTDHPTDSVKA